MLKRTQAISQIVSAIEDMRRKSKCKELISELQRIETELKTSFIMPSTVFLYRENIASRDN